MQVTSSDNEGDWVVLEKRSDGSYSKVFTLHHKSDSKKLETLQMMEQDVWKFEKRGNSASRNSNRLNFIEKPCFANSKTREMDKMVSEQKLLKPKSSPKKLRNQSKGKYQNCLESSSNVNGFSRGYLNLDSNNILPKKIDFFNVESVHKDNTQDILGIKDYNHNQCSEVNAPDSAFKFSNISEIKKQRNRNPDASFNLSDEETLVSQNFENPFRNINQSVKKNKINLQDIVSKINRPVKTRRNPFENAENSSTFLLENLTPLDYKNRQKYSIDLGKPQFVSSRSKTNYFKKIDSRFPSKQNLKEIDSKETSKQNLRESSQYIIQEKKEKDFLTKNDFLTRNDSFQKKHITIKREDSFSSQLESMVNEQNKSVQRRCGSSDKKNYKIPSSSIKLLDDGKILRGSVDKTLLMIENYRNLPLKNRIKLNQQNKTHIDESRNSLTPIKPRFNIMQKMEIKDHKAHELPEDKSELNLTRRYSGSLKHKIEGLILKRKKNGSNLKLKIDSIKKKGLQFIKKFDEHNESLHGRKSSKNSFILNKSNNSLMHRHSSPKKGRNDRSISQNITKDTSMPFYQRPKIVIEYPPIKTDRN